MVRASAACILEELCSISLWPVLICMYIAQSEVCSKLVAFLLCPGLKGVWPQDRGPRQAEVRAQLAHRDKALIALHAIGAVDCPILKRNNSSRLQPVGDVAWVTTDDSTVLCGLL